MKSWNLNIFYRERRFEVGIFLCEGYNFGDNLLYISFLVGLILQGIDPFS